MGRPNLASPASSGHETNLLELALATVLYMYVCHTAYMYMYIYSHFLMTTSGNIMIAVQYNITGVYLVLIIKVEIQLVSGKI